MKLYRIKAGTWGRLIDASAAVATHKAWCVRTDRRFIESLIDPIRYANGHRIVGEQNNAFNELAKDGYAIFGGEYGCEPEEKYYIAVPYSQLEVN